MKIMKELLAANLNEIVRGNHRAAAVFEKYNLDFYARGERSLLQACQQRGLSAESIAAQLSNLEKSSLPAFVTSYDPLSVSQLIDLVVDTHHTYVKKELPQIMSCVQQVAVKHGTTHPEMIKVLELVTTLKEEKELHMRKEELILFPRIRLMEEQALAGHQRNVNKIYLQSPIMVLESEHEHALKLMTEIRQLTNDYRVPGDGCPTYRLLLASLQAFEIDLYYHVNLENTILFPRALKLFED
jgi:regulator of cell morphogenesis and NO signaling